MWFWRLLLKRVSQHPDQFGNGLKNAFIFPKTYVNFPALKGAGILTRKVFAVYVSQTDRIDLQVELNQGVLPQCT